MKPKLRIGHVNSDHLWFGTKNGYNAAIKDFKESGKEDSTACAVVKLQDVELLLDQLTEVLKSAEQQFRYFVLYKDEGDEKLRWIISRSEHMQKQLSEVLAADDKARGEG